MSRRKLQWKRNAAQAGSVEKLLPGSVKGTGIWLSQMTIDGKSGKAGGGEDSQVSLPISTRKEQLVRNWAK
jgi:hypothetical protein